MIGSSKTSFGIVLPVVVLLMSWVWTGNAAEKRILTSFYPVHIATLNVTAGVSGVQVAAMAPPSAGCLHDYQLATDDMVNLSKADILIVNGLGAEAFLDAAMKRLNKLKVINASEGIEPMVVNGETNAHVWLSVKLHIRQVNRIAEGLALADPGHANTYRVNAAAYVGRLKDLQTRYEAGFKGGGVRAVVTFHDAFPYFARDYGFTVVTVVERHPGAQPNARELRDAIQVIRQRGVGFVFAEPQYPPVAAELIAKETGARVLLLDPVVSGLPRAEAYVEIMDRNLATLQQAFARPAQAAGEK
jgi:zinc transport system substrate-binding protein